MTKPARARALLIIAATLGAGVPLAVAQPSGGTTGSAATEHWQRQQPTKDRARDLMREEGVAAPPEVRREQLRDLNATSRDLLPPGAPLPAPRLAEEPPRQSGRN